MRKAAGRVLVWVWKADAELVVVTAQIQQATNDLRAARAMMPMAHDDTESFRNPHLGIGEKLEMALPRPAHSALRHLYVGHRHALRDGDRGVLRPRAVRHGHRQRRRPGPHGSGVEDLAVPDVLRIEPLG